MTKYDGAATGSGLNETLGGAQHMLIGVTNTPAERAAAALVVARSAYGPEDHQQLLDVLGLIDAPQPAGPAA